MQGPEWWYERSAVQEEIGNGKQGGDLWVGRAMIGCGEKLVGRG